MTIELSAVIPTLNRAEMLVETLESFALQTIDSDRFEVLVIDNGSDDHTKAITERYKDRIKNLSYHYQASPGLHSARHHGLRHSKAEILFFCDDDVTLSKDCLKQVLLTFLNYPVHLVGGKVLPNFIAEPPDWLLEKWEQPGPYGQVLFHLSLLNLGNQIREIPAHLVYGCNFSVSKEVLYNCEGFHPDGFTEHNKYLRGDGETHVAKHITASNLKALYNPEILVWHRISADRLTKEYLFKRMYLAGISASYCDMRKSYLNPSHKKKRSLFREIIKIIYYNLLIGSNSPLKRRILKAYWQGFYAHRIRALTNKELRRWITKSNYL